MKKKVIMLVVSMMVCASFAACGKADADNGKNDKVDIAIETVSEDVTETSDVEEEPTEVDVVEEETTETAVEESQDVVFVNENIKAGLEDLVRHYTEKAREAGTEVEEIEVPDEFVIESCADLGLSDDATFRDFFDAVKAVMLEEADVEDFTDEEVEEYIYVNLALYQMPEITIEDDGVEVESSFNTDTTSEDNSNKINGSITND